MDNHRETSREAGRREFNRSKEFLYAFFEIQVKRRQSLPGISYKTWTNILPICCSRRRDIVFEHDSLIRVLLPMLMSKEDIGRPGQMLEAEFFRELAELLGIVKSRTTPYYPHADGNTERFNRTLEGMLRFLRLVKS